MAPLHRWICTLLAIAMTFASVVSLWAATAHMAPMVPQQQTAMSHASQMSDCERMMQTAKAVSPDRHKDKSCADNFCLAKCFKVFGDLSQPRILVGMPVLPHQPQQLDQPAYWSDQPPSAPPRT